jgi:uncharacterized protein with LGFP repeats
VFDVVGLGTHGVRPVIWSGHGATIATGQLGYPGEDGHPSKDKVGWRQVFQAKKGATFAPSAVFTVHPAFGAFAVVGPAIAPWSAAGAETGVGYPTATTQPTPDGFGTYTPLARMTTMTQRSTSAMVTNGNLGGFIISGPLFATWLAAGGVLGLGYPLTGAVPTLGDLGTTQRFAPVANTGVNYAAATTLVSSSSGTFALTSQIAAAWSSTQDQGGTVGVPTAAPVTASSGTTPYVELRCSRGRIYVSTVLSSCVLSGPLLDAYLTAGGPLGSLGLPLTPVVTDGPGISHVTFERGTLTLTGNSVVTS